MPWKLEIIEDITPKMRKKEIIIFQKLHVELEALFHVTCRVGPTVFPPKNHLLLCYQVGVRKPSEHPAQHHAVEAPGGRMQVEVM